MSTYVHRVMVVPASLVDLCRQLAASFESGSGMFMTALSPTGQAPATHYISSGSIWEQFADLLASPEALSQGAGIPIDQAQAILGVCTVSDADPWSVLGELGLWMCERISVNIATVSELVAVPGVSEARAQGIVDGRPWASVQELFQVSGISEAAVALTLQHWYTT
jgi:hypothetical protein